MSTTRRANSKRCSNPRGGTRVPAQGRSRLNIVPSDQPIWNTPAPSGPLFTVTYNGSYPSVTESAPQAIYTGPSVESVADKNASSNNPTGGKLGAAIGVPLVVVALVAAAYVTWNRFRKRPQKKQFSAVVDKRMSMISQGTWQPRPSMALSSGHRPSGSMYSTANRHSYFADPNQRHSTYSVSQGSPLRPPQPAEMRQRGVGEGDRISRVSFAGGEPRPSFTSSRAGGHGKNGSIYNTAGSRSSLHQSQRSRTAIAYPQSSPPLSQSARPDMLTSSTSSSSLVSSTSSSGGRSRFEDPISRSGTKEELRDSPSVTQFRFPAHVPPSSSTSTAAGAAGHAHKPSMTSSLRNEINQEPAAPEDPFKKPAAPVRPRLSPLATTNVSAMPQLSSEHVLSPDQALASYSFGARAISPAQPPTPSTGPPPPPPVLSTATSSNSLRLKATQMLHKFKSNSSLNKRNAREEDEMRRNQHERSMSPFEDPQHELPPMAIDQIDSGLEWFEIGADEDELDERKKNEQAAETSWKGGKAL
ncbi:uncharacterized protein JCM15063_006460 [Sporobolomyces koalae]|uniref:uncharacterized protein n=1 Tax=Sporobolomyces koalae TaxID=500713 RepID=UPI003170C326